MLRLEPLESDTKTKLLETAEELMLSRGYAGTTLDNICCNADLTKGSFFHYFRNKEELCKALLERFAKRQADRFSEACEAIEDPLDRVYLIVDCAIGSARDPNMKGCLVGTVAQEIAESNPDLREVCQACFDNCAKGIADDLIAAKERHCPDKDFDAASLGEYFLSLAQGSMLLFKTSGNRSTLERNMIHFRQYLKLLYGR